MMPRVDTVEMLARVLSVTAGMPVWADPKDLVFVQDTMPEYIRAAEPTAQNDQYEGMLLYNTTDHKLKVCTTPGEAEWDAVTVTGAATSAGNVTITLNNVDVNVAVGEGDGVNLVAEKIRAATFSGCSTFHNSGEAPLANPAAKSIVPIAPSKMSVSFWESKVWKFMSPRGKGD